MMKNFFIITNSYKDKDLKVTRMIQDYIETKGGKCTYYVSLGEERNSDCVEEDAIPENLDCILVLGGDGTLIRAARDTVQRKVPLIGINMGNLGYLCELEEKTVLSAIDQIMEENYMIENRMRLSGHPMCDGKTLTGQTALNDIVIHREGGMQIVNLVVYVNGEYLSTFQGDGVIVSTPTGSTGYNLSAGGPIIDPKARMIVITPINSHTLSSKSIVLAAEDEVIVEIDSRRRERDEKVVVSFDGDRNMSLSVGDQIVIHQAKLDVRILKLSKISFLEILRKKMQGY